MSSAVVQRVRVEPGAAFIRGGWLTSENSTDLGRAIIRRALDDVGIVESPVGSNRGPRIDEYLRRANVPESLIRAWKGWWCAAAVGAWWADCGASVPRDYASCDAWLPFLMTDGKRAQPQPGDAILYGLRDNAHHIGVVARVIPMMLTIEGNRAFAGTTNNGVAVDIHPPQRKDILGYIRPQKGLA